jgi:predicted metalloendopeptidase
LSKEFRDEAFSFYGNILGGQSKPSPRDKQCISSVDGAIGILIVIL